MKKCFKNLFVLATAPLTLAGCNPGNGGNPTCTHAFGDWIVDVKPTESSTGHASRACDLCDEDEELTLPVLTDAAYQKGVDSATCQAAGQQEYTFTHEGKEIKFNVNTAKTGHVYVHHDATALSEQVINGNDEYYTCSMCSTLFDKNKQVIESLDEIAIHYYEADATGHWHGDKASLVAHTYGDPIVDKEATYFEKGEQHKVCSACGYSLTEEISEIDIGTLSADGTYNATKISTIVVDGANKLADGLWAFGKDAEKDKFDTSNGNITFGEKANVDSRVFLIKTAGAVKMTVKAAAAKAGTETKFGIFDGEPNADSNNFVTTMGIGTSSVSSTADYVYNIPAAGKYWFGADAGLKVKSITVEVHAIDTVNWQKDETGHWHGNADSACKCRDDFAAHTFGEWIEVDAENDRKVCECGYEVVEAKALHAGCQHTYVETIDAANGVINCVCSKCQDSYTKGYSLFLPSTATANDETVNVMAHAEGIEYTVGQTTASSWYKGKLTANTLVEGHEFTMGDGTTKRTFTNYAGTKSGKDVNDYYCSVTVPGACVINFYLQSGGAPNPRYTVVGGAVNQNMFTTKPAESSFYTFSYTMSEAGELQIGSSNKTDTILVYAIEIIY